MLYVKAQFCLFNGTKKCIYRSEPGPWAMIQPGFLSHQVERKPGLDLVPHQVLFIPSIQACSSDVLVKEAASPHLEVNL